MAHNPGTFISADHVVSRPQGTGAPTGSPQAVAPIHGGRDRRYFQDLSFVRCYACNDWGHYSYNCPNVLRNGVNLVQVSLTKCCEKLGEVPIEHRSNEVGSKKLDGAYFEAMLGEEKVLAFADSGAGRSFINGTLVGG